MKKFLFSLLTLSAFLAGNDLNAFNCCPQADLIVSRITITGTPADNNIQFEYELKNVGLDTMFLNRMLIQNYVSQDNSFVINDGTDKAAGGAIFDSNTPYLLPGETYISTYSSYPSGTTLATYPYLIVDIKLRSGQTMPECTLSNNYGIVEITGSIAEAAISSFSLAEKTSDAIIDNTNHTIEQEVLYGTDVTNLTPAFTISSGATSDPVSGIPMDFTCAAVIEVTSSTGNTQLWSIVVSEEPNYAPTDITIDNTEIEENMAVSSIIGNFSTTDSNSNQSHSYSLVAGAGDTDNTAFSISENKLLTAQSFDFESKSTYNIRVKSVDSGEMSFEKTFTITIIDVDETTTAVADGLNQTVIAYPNPSSGMLSLQLPDATYIPDAINIIDLSGKVVYKLANTAIKGPIVNVPLIHLKHGTYIVNFKSKGVIYNIRFQKE